MMYQNTYQINGTAAHEKIDGGTYSTKKNVFMGMDVFCEKYNLIGKIDIFDLDKKILRERKKCIKQIYDGYVFQVYAQYFSLVEMGYEVSKIELYSMDDNKTYQIPLPKDDSKMMNAFERTIKEINEFDLNEFIQSNSNKCMNCIYEPACDRALLVE